MNPDHARQFARASVFRFRPLIVHAGNVNHRRIIKGMGVHLDIAIGNGQRIAADADAASHPVDTDVVAERAEARLEAVVTESSDVLSKLTAEEWLRVRRIQGFEVTGLAALFHTVPHFRGHTQEIIFRTRCLLGQKYEFFWKPTTPEQGAPV
jgi:hypothetical protein